MAPKLPLPRGWKRRVRSSVLHILALGGICPSCRCDAPRSTSVPDLNGRGYVRLN